MKVLNLLTKRNLGLNKKRTIVTIIGIVLSTALIVCVSGMVTSFQATLVNSTIREDGNYHAMINNMDKSDIESLKNNREVKEYYEIEDLGYAQFNSLNEYKPYLFIKAYDDLALNNLGIQLTQGRKPENSNEIIIGEHLIKDGGLDKKIGDSIILNVGMRYIIDENEKEYLNQNNPYILEDAVGDEDFYPEYFEVREEKTFTIVGIMKRPSSSFEGYNAPGYTCITFMDKERDVNQKSVAILYKNPKNYARNTKDIASDKYDYKYNSELLRWLGVSQSGIMNALYLVAGVVISIIIISSVFVIKNSFAISITEKYKMYGMMRSVGATSKQIKKNVLFEGFILGLISIPLGIICGIIAIVCLVFLINYILADYLNGIKFVYSIPLIPIFLSIILASLTIYFSTIFTARKAARITAIEAIRNNNEIKIKAKKLKTPKIIEKVFKTGGVIAYKNLKRNKKKYRTTVVSIVVSVFVFISLYSFIDFGFKMTGLYYTEMDYNIAIYPDLENEYLQEFENKIINNSEVERYSYLKHGLLQIDVSYLSDYGKKISDLYDYEDLNITVYAVGDQEFEHYLKEIGLNEKDSDKGILIDEYKEIINKKTYLGNIYNVKDNQIINGTTISFDDEKEEKDIAIEVIRSDKKPMGLEASYSLGGYLIVSDKFLEDNFDVRPSSMFIKTKNPSNMETYIKNLIKENPQFKNIDYENVENYVKEMNAMVLIVSIFLYGFIIVISLIGITNIFNTITTNMNLRSKEFAMLKSIGMTKKEFNRMIRLESIFYGTKSLIIGLPLGLLGSYFIYLAFKGGLEMSYIIPFKAIIIVILFVAIMIGIIMRYSLKKINKQNITETIRNDNI